MFMHMGNGVRQWHSTILKCVFSVVVAFFIIGIRKTVDFRRLAYIRIEFLLSFRSNYQIIYGHFNKLF